MERSAYSPAQTLQRLPKVLETLRNAPPQEIRTPTSGHVRELLQGQDTGLYVFCRRADGVPVYVDRSANMSQRLGLNHRSTQKNQAAVTKAIKDKLGIHCMKGARETLYREYVVRLIPEADTVTRALTEIYAAMSWDTEFNSFREH